MKLELTGSTALVTGASAGIGVEFARALAAAGSDLVLVARREDRLQSVAEDLRRAHGVDVSVIAADLGRPGAGRSLAAELATRGLTIHTLVNNAGFGTLGAFGSIDPDRVAMEIQLNVGTLVELTGALLPQIVASKGIVLNVASTAAFQPIPGMAVYGGTKAFVLSFTEALWVETRETGVRVLVVCPGATESEFGAVAGTTASGADFGKKQTAAELVAEAIHALTATSAPSMVSGLRNRLLARSVGFMPRRVVLAVADRLAGRVRTEVSTVAAGWSEPAK